MSIGLSFDGTDPDPTAPPEVGPAPDLVGDDVDDADRGNFPYGARFDDEQWATLTEIRAALPQDPG